jgi:hypothetical protein
MPSKINNNYYLIKGKNMDNFKKAIENSEKEFISFIKTNDVGKCISWECKPFTAYIADSLNTKDSLKFNYKGEKKAFKYVTTLKENFAQRISNESFKYCYRVGISLPH